MTASLSRNKSLIRPMQEFFFSLNLALAGALVLLARGFVFLPTNGEFEPRIAFKYYFLRTADRIAAFLHLTSSAWIQEFTFLLSIACLVLCLIALLRLVSGTAFHRAILHPVAGVTASLAVPMAWLYVVHLVIESHMEGIQGQQVWGDPLEFIALGYGFAILAFFFLIRKQTLSVRVLYAFLVLQIALWIWLIAGTWDEITRAFYHQHLVLYLAITIFPSSVYAWALYFRQLRSDANLQAIIDNHRKYAWVACAVSLIVLSLLWLPRPSTNIADTKDMRSLVVTMARTGCFGSCPTYTLTVRAGGSVEYVGKNFVRIAGPETTTMSAGQFAGLVQDLDDVHFFSLDDQAFERCYDTAKVIVSVSVDGKSKRVTSDSYCVGSRSGPQAQLVAVTRKIDAMVSSDRWVRCSGQCIHH